MNDWGKLRRISGPFADAVDASGGDHNKLVRLLGLVRGRGRPPAGGDPCMTAWTALHDVGGPLADAVDASGGDHNKLVRLLGLVRPAHRPTDDRRSSGEIYAQYLNVRDAGEKVCLFYSDFDMATGKVKQMISREKPHNVVHTLKWPVVNSGT